MIHPVYVAHFGLEAVDAARLEGIVRSLYASVQLYAMPSAESFPDAPIELIDVIVCAGFGADTPARLESLKSRAPHVPIVVWSDDFEPAISWREGVFLTDGERASGDGLREVLERIVPQRRITDMEYGRDKGSRQLSSILQTVIDALNECAYVVNAAGDVVQNNSACTRVRARLGLPPLRPLPRRPLVQVMMENPYVAAAGGDRVAAAIDKMMEEGFAVQTWRDLESGAYRYDATFRGGRCVYQESTFYLVRLEGSLSRRATARTDSPEFSRERLHRMSRIAGGLALEFNDLLVGILGNAELAREDLEVNDAARECLDDIVVSARRAAELCRLMLSVEGPLEPPIRRLSFPEFLEENRARMALAASGRAQLVIESEGAAPWVDGNAKLLGMALLCLVENASDAIGKGPGRIRVSYGVERGSDIAVLRMGSFAPLNAEWYSYFEVEDSGSGFRKELFEDALEPFFSTKGPGHRGLGLTIALGAIRQHSGGLALARTSSAGTAMRIYLPSAAARQPGETILGDEEGKGGRERRPLILLADPEEAVVAVARRALREGGYDVISATHSKGALDALLERIADVEAAVLDVAMPSLDGVELLTEIRRVKPGLRIVLTSTYSQHEVVGSIRKGGEAAFLQKPYRSATLLETVKALLSRVK